MKVTAEPRDDDPVVVAFRDRRSSLVRTAVLLVGDRSAAEDIVHDCVERFASKPRPHVEDVARYLHRMVDGGADRVWIDGDPNADPRWTHLVAVTTRGVVSVGIQCDVASGPPVAPERIAAIARATFGLD